MALPIILLLDWLFYPHTPYAQQLRPLARFAKAGARITLAMVRRCIDYEQPTMFAEKKRLLYTKLVEVDKGEKARIDASEKNLEEIQIAKKNGTKPPKRIHRVRYPDCLHCCLRHRIRRARTYTEMPLQNLKVDEDEYGEKGASIFQPTKKFILPEAYRAQWQHDRERRTLIGLSIAGVWICFCVFYLFTFSLCFAATPSEIGSMFASGAISGIINGLLRPLIAAILAALLIVTSVRTRRDPQTAAFSTGGTKAATIEDEEDKKKVKKPRKSEQERGDKDKDQSASKFMQVKDASGRSVLNEESKKEEKEMEVKGGEGGEMAV
uniref:Uncharacterized protein n=1 Tax=Chromera velia CCMP2878 TaxID=1169474 RepID=A0A0G4F7I9_9ALVE|eukprot:Cvel_15623.t1-p1 / transcript=Cvel_15623.t1 / gene=Cvel_15623 / organism=Chromera_velia_CCMP2878 / gene_product=hypothetical protein / transcript_product=hypothetical protein / location=Cvel_scaffold1163:43433-44398(+) / protein_length=322 / sequence_SO=supercontig / SO=protein_coding / is_pseudo=false